MWKTAEGCERAGRDLSAASSLKVPPDTTALPCLPSIITASPLPLKEREKKERETTTTANHARGFFYSFSYFVFFLPKREKKEKNSHRILIKLIG